MGAQFKNPQNPSNITALWYRGVGGLRVPHYAGRYLPNSRGKNVQSGKNF